MTAVQYPRKCTLTVASTTQVLDLSQLRVTFEITAADIETPNVAKIRVYNPGDDTVYRVLNEFTSVTLQAGYAPPANFGVIYQGSIRQCKKGRENPTDTYLEILGVDGDLAYNFATINVTLDKTHTSVADRYAALGQALAAQGIVIGPLPTEVANTGGVLPRGKVLYGMARAYMRDLAKTTQSTWSIQDGKLQLVSLTSYLPGQIVKLTSDTGLIGLPEQTDNGIKMRCLINPLLRVGGLVQIDNKSIQSATINPQFTALNQLASTSQDGVYRILVNEFRGDTRGNDWYNDLVCLAVDPTANPNNSVRAYG